MFLFLINQKRKCISKSNGGIKRTSIKIHGTAERDDMCRYYLDSNYYLRKEKNKVKNEIKQIEWCYPKMIRNRV